MKCPKCKSGTVRGVSLGDKVQIKCRKCRFTWDKNVKWWKNGR